MRYHRVTFEESNQTETALMALALIVLTVEKKISWQLLLNNRAKLEPASQAIMVVRLSTMIGCKKRRTRRTEQSEKVSMLSKSE